MFDTVIIGAGVTGSAIARELSRYQARILVVEREEDVCCGTSKANSAIVHAGFDAEPGSLKAEMNVKGNRMMDQIAQELDVPFKRNGSIVVCTKDQDPAGLEKLAERGRANGVPTQILSREALLEKEPNLADDVTCGLFAPTGGIVCPFELTMGFAENAVMNGAQFSLNTQVRSIEKSENGWRLTVYHRDTQQEETIETKTVVNAAGVYADEFNNMVSAHKMHITARKGEYILLDKTAGKHVSSTIFQLPTAMGKGVLVTPTVHGNLLVGQVGGTLQTYGERVEARPPGRTRAIVLHTVTGKTGSDSGDDTRVETTGEEHTVRHITHQLTLHGAHQALTDLLHRLAIRQLTLRTCLAVHPRTGVPALHAFVSLLAPIVMTGEERLVAVALSLEGFEL